MQKFISILKRLLKVDSGNLQKNKLGSILSKKTSNLKEINIKIALDSIIELYEKEEIKTIPKIESDMLLFQYGL
jgi:hypothetical protein